MFWSIVFFELRYQLRQPLFWLVGLLFGLMTFGATSSDTVQIGGAIGNVHRNAPFVILQMSAVLSIVGIFLIVAFVASALLRDFERGTHELFFSRPVKERDLLLGRFVGSVTVASLCFAGALLGLVIGSWMPWIDPERLGPFRIGPYLFAIAFFVVPNFVFAGAVFFSLAAKTRSIMSTYMGVIGFFALYVLSGQMLSDVENAELAAMLDPFGAGALGFVTRYWTIVERNGSLPEIGGILLWNRLLWVGLGIAVLAFTVARFRYAKAAAPKKRRRKEMAEAAEDRPSGLVGQLPSRPIVRPAWTSAAARTQLAATIRLELRTVLRSVPFLVMLAFALFNIIAGSGFVDRIFGTTVHPVSHLMLQAIQGSYAFMLVIILTFYGGEMIWRERSMELDGVFDALPTPDWLPVLGKLIALWIVTILFLAGGVVSAVGIQLWKGFTGIEPMVYLKGSFFLAVPFLLVACLSIFFQVLADGKFGGYALMILYLVSGIVFGALDLQHNLYNFAGPGGAPYSDMNGYGHFVEPALWFWTYWSFFSLGLIVLAVLLRTRGTDRSWALRFAEARRRFRGPLPAIAGVAALGFVATGSWIFYNTNVLNEYLPNDESEARQARWEKDYSQYEGLAQPRILAVDSKVDIFPDQRRVDVEGTYRLVNRSGEPISEWHVIIPPGVEVDRLDLPEHTVRVDDRELGYSILELARPMEPGEEVEIAFDLRVENPGFVNHASNTSIVGNGTFFNNRSVFPSFGYTRGAELVDRGLRREHDLEPDRRWPKIDDEDARGNTYISTDTDWIDFQTVVSTSSDQIALSTGNLVEEWTEGDRRYFRYVMDVPMLGFWPYLSARYEVQRDRWNDIDLEIYYHPGHEYNLDRMMDAMKKSLAEFEASFSPYQHDYVRIVEFPRYAQFAQAFAGTIPFAESIGFIARLDEDDEDAIDYPFYVTSHEVAHQWWAHQVIGAAVQGATLLSETLAQYSALQVMENEYGSEHMTRFLRFELDSYLQGRGGELVEEMPLALVENQQYVHYRKGSIQTWALRDLIGEEAMDGVISDYVAEVAYQQPPYTVSRELTQRFDALIEEHPRLDQEVLEDLFERIVLFENEVSEATWEETDDGRYRVRISAKARKLRADGQGIETEVPVADWIDVAVFGDDDEVLFLEKRRVEEAEPVFEVVVDAEPKRVGFDPYHKLIDRNPEDNTARATQAG